MSFGNTVIFPVPSQLYAIVVVKTGSTGKGLIMTSAKVVIHETSTASRTLMVYVPSIKSANTVAAVHAPPFKLYS